VVDAGGLAGGDVDVGDRVVSRALWSLGIASIDRLVVTHADADHAGGAPAIARNFRPAEVWVPSGWRSIHTTAARALSEALPDRTWLREVARGEGACLSGSRLAVMHPPGGVASDPGDNESSIVLSMTVRGGAVLLMGDAGLPTEARLASVLPPARLLKVGHHGSRGATGGPFLERTHPSLAIISCGAGNRFGHPHAATLRRLAASGAHVVRTDEAGALEVELLDGGTRLRALSGTTGRRAGG
jgi:competence protein ComEC